MVVTIGGEKLEITPLGAGNEVGRSCIVLQFKGKTIMFDCGIHPALTGLNALPCFDEVDISSIDLLLITHFHLDHSGALPYFLTKTTFDGTTYMTHPTKAIIKLLFSDFVKVSNIGNDHEKLYTAHELNLALHKMKLIDYHQEMEHSGIKFWCYNAGHVLGAAMFMIELAGIRVLYTGDYSCEEDRHLQKAEIPDMNVDILIVESTYGVQVHQSRASRERLFTSTVHEIVRGGGRCLLPVFALGRAQELLLILDEYWHDHPEIQRIPIYYASSLAKKCMPVFRTYLNMMGNQVKLQFEQGHNPFEFRHISNLQSMDYFDDSAASVVMASPGMLQNGQSRDLFERWCGDSKNGLVLTGYCVENTLAKEILNSRTEVQMTDGTIRPIMMSVSYISFSAHSDYDQTSNFIDKVKPAHIVLVHGDSIEMGRLKLKLEKEFRNKFRVFTPTNHQTVEFTFEIRKNAKIVLGDEMLEEGVIVKKEPDHIIMGVDSLTDYTTIGVNTIRQKLRVPYAHSLQLLQYLLNSLFPGVQSLDVGGVACLLVGGGVTITPEKSGNLLLEWMASPQGDIVADSVALLILQIRSSPSPALLQAMSQMDSDESKFRFLLGLIQQRFANTIFDAASQTISVTTSGQTVNINCKVQTVEGDSEVLVECVREMVKSVYQM